MDDDGGCSAWVDYHFYFSFGGVDFKAVLRARPCKRVHHCLQLTWWISGVLWIFFFGGGSPAGSDLAELKCPLTRTLWYLSDRDEPLVGWERFIQPTLKSHKMITGESDGHVRLWPLTHMWRCRSSGCKRVLQPAGRTLFGLNDTPGSCKSGVQQECLTEASLL